MSSLWKGCKLHMYSGFWGRRWRGIEILKWPTSRVVFHVFPLRNGLPPRLSGRLYFTYFPKSVPTKSSRLVMLNFLSRKCVAHGAFWTCSTLRTASSPRSGCLNLAVYVFNTICTCHQRTLEYSLRNGSSSVNSWAATLRIPSFDLSYTAFSIYSVM